MRRPFTRLSTLAMMMAMMAPGTAKPLTSNSPAATVSSKEAVTNRDKRPSVQSEAPRSLFRSSRVGNPAGRFLNQKQYRKKCRQNPWMYKSKKHRSKN